MRCLLSLHPIFPSGIPCPVTSSTASGPPSPTGEGFLNQCASYCGMESRPKSKKYTLTRDAMPDRVGIPCNSHSELMPCQALRSWINKKTNRSSSFYFGRAYSTKVEPIYKYCSHALYLFKTFSPINTLSFL